MKSRTFRIICGCLIKNRISLLLFAIITVMNFGVFLLYNLPLEPFIYSEILCFAFLFILLVGSFFSMYKSANTRERDLNSAIYNKNCLPKPQSLEQEDYFKAIKLISDNTEKLSREYFEERKNATDYYTAWVHQIKTPIAVMKLRLSNDTEKDRELLSELFRIEQYVDMVLSYIRLRSTVNDLCIKEYSLDEILKESIRKFAPQFIARKLSIEYTPCNTVVVTDKKWLTCILEQFISNAIKYTKSGKITISVNGNSISVTDTGIGIASEDIPRIFEKGYTGNNGRLGEKSSGLGLYLASKAAKMLDISLSCQSTEGIGSTFSVTFGDNQTVSK